MISVMHLASLVMEVNRKKLIHTVVVVILAKALVSILVKVVMLDVIQVKIVVAEEVFANLLLHLKNIKKKIWRRKIFAVLPFRS